MSIRENLYYSERDLSLAAMDTNMSELLVSDFIVLLYR